MVLTTKVTETICNGGNDDSSGEFSPASPAPLLDSGGSS